MTRNGWLEFKSCIEFNNCILSVILTNVECDRQTCKLDICYNHLGRESQLRLATFNWPVGMSMEELVK